MKSFLIHFHKILLDFLSLFFILLLKLHKDFFVVFLFDLAKQVLVSGDLHGFSSDVISVVIMGALLRLIVSFTSVPFLGGRESIVSIVIFKLFNNWRAIIRVNFWLHSLSPNNFSRLFNSRPFLTIISSTHWRVIFPNNDRVIVLQSFTGDQRILASLSTAFSILHQSACIIVKTLADDLYELSLGQAIRAYESLDLEKLVECGDELSPCQTITV